MGHNSMMSARVAIAPSLRIVVLASTKQLDSCLVRLRRSAGSCRIELLAPLLRRLKNRVPRVLGRDL